jgi:hypothetical protein
LQKLIHTYNTQIELTIILIDANDSLYKKQSPLPDFLHNINLCPLISNLELYPSTHIRGSQCIDFIFGSPTLFQHIDASGMTAFYDLPWPASNHRGLFIDINVIGLFGATLHSIPTLLPRKITSISMKSCNRFIQQIIKSNKVPSLLSQINSLSQLHQWSPIEHILIEELDSTFTTMLLQAEALVALPSNNFWNKELHNKYIIYTYWVTIIKGLKNRREVSSQLQKLRESNPTIDMHQANPNRSAQKQLQHARKDLIEARTNSFNNRQVFLDHLQEKRIESGDTGRAHIIDQIKKSERR